ncbi:MAG: PorP/SprF family type IX secretion system membrane protein [Crocinitomicaceae bacterium]|nr:PorP/SprF family type IX secretion system membrane protein [Crocinitomicaceae bacterium]
MKSLYLFVAFTACSIINLNAQQEAQFLNVANNPYMVNSAAGGLGDVVQVELSSRVQWLGYSGGPRSFLLSANSQVKFKKGEDKVLEEFNREDKPFFAAPTNTTGSLKHIIGGKVFNDMIGPFAKTSVFGSYAIHMPFTKKLNFGAGLGIGWSNFRIDESRVKLYETDDMAYSQFLGNSSGQNILDANAGVVFYNEHFFGGFSVSQLFKNDAVFDGVDTESNFNRHYFLVLKYGFDVRDNFTIEPTVVGKMAENSPISMDIGARFIFNKSIWLGIQYRTSNAVTFQLGANLIKNLYLSYGYEQSTGAVQTRNGGTHEIQLGIYLGRKRNIDKEIREGAETPAEEE